MKIKFSKQPNSDIISALRQTMEGRALGQLVSIGEEDGHLVVKISKLGTSTLQFNRSEQGSDAIFTLTVEKIAFAHKAFKDEVKSKFVQVVEKSGGTVLES
jgi:hypothetical protein